MHPTKQGDVFDKCPRAWLRDEGREAAEFVSDWQWMVGHGILPRAGGKLDQDPRFVEAVYLIAVEATAIEKAKARERQGGQRQRLRPPV